MVYASISFRPSKKSLEEFRHLVVEEDVPKSEAAREVFEVGLHAIRQKKALEKFYAGKISFLSAARQAGLSAYEFMEVLRQKKIPWVHMTEQEIEDDWKVAGE